MTIILDLAPEDEAKLNNIAAQKGQNADTVAYGLFSAALADFPAAANGASHPAAEWSAEPLPEIELSPEEEEEAIRLGLEDSFAGRVTPLAEWSARFRARHNIPEGARAMTHEEALRLP